MAAPKGNQNALGNKGNTNRTGLDILWDGWYNDILDLYSEGASDVEIRAMIYKKTKGKTKASYTLWDRWLEDEIEFSETIKAGRLLAESWWHRNGRQNLQNKEFNFTGWYMQMKNRFGWKDRHDHTTNDKDIAPVFQVATKEAKDELEKLYERPDSPNS